MTRFVSDEEMATRLARLKDVTLGPHSHETVEVFIPLTGRWKLMWGGEGEQSVVLEPGDCLSVPTDVMRGFENVGDAILVAITGGDDPGKLEWAEPLEAKVAAVEGARS